MTNDTTRNEVQKLEPCEDMKDYISAFSDGSLTGLHALFTRFHLLHCTHCRNALAGFIALRGQLLALNESASLPQTEEVLTADNRSALQKSLDALDSQA